MNRRRNACTPGTYLIAARTAAGYARFRRGRNQFPVRWNTYRRATCSAISGTNWTALAPVPITATRLPARSYSWSQRAEWKLAPANSSRPSTDGIAGW